MLLAAVALSSSANAQIGFAQLVTGKPKAAAAKPADAKSATSTPAQPAPAPQPAADTGPQIIPLPEVAEHSEQLTQTLNELTETLPTKEQLDGMNTSIADKAAMLNEKRGEAAVLLSSAPSSIELREQENYWRGVQTFSAARRKQLLDWANAAQTAIDKVDQLEPQWSATLDAYKGQHDLEPLLDLIRQNLTRIRKLRSDAKDELQLIVKMQIATGTQDQLAAEVLSRLLGAQEVYKDKLLRRDSLPFWQLGLRRQEGENQDLFSSAGRRWATIGAFLTEKRGMMVFLVVVLVLSMLVALRLRIITRAVHPADQLQQEALLILRRWVALGLLAPLLLAYTLVPTAPLSAIGLAILVSFFPILRLLAPLMQPRQRLMLYCLAGYFGLNAIVTWLGFRPVLRRELGFMLGLGIFLTFAYFLRPTWLSSLRKVGGGRPMRIFAARLAVVALGASLVSNLFGYVRLAQYLGLATVYSAFIGINMYTGTRVYTTLLRAGLSLPESDRVAVVRLHRAAVLRWMPRIFNWAALLIWLSATLDLLRLRDAVVGGLHQVLNFHIAGSASEVTLGSVLGFFAMLGVGYIIASGIRFFLREEVLNRFNLSRGLPDLIASTVYYLLLLFVFLVAVNAGGIELNKFTLLTGALGVGFGFGLQNIINNFVSGLILQFERPIHINDVLEVEGFTGKVTRIGVRSSTLQTAQGAEVIIPNGNLISGKVINWTLSESKRRAELQVGVAYGTDAALVTKLLLDAANRHESVLTDPAPAAYLKNFGESSLDFELHFWVMQDSNWIRVRSEIALVVMKSLADAGVEIPFPQRDLHLRSVEAGAGIPQEPSSSAKDEDKPVSVRAKVVSADGD